MTRIAACGLAIVTALTAQRSVAEAAEQRLGDPTLAADARVELMLQRARALLAYDLPKARTAAQHAAATANRLGRPGKTVIALATAAAATCELDSTANGLLLIQQARAELPADASAATRAYVLLVESTISLLDLRFEAAARQLAGATDLATAAGDDSVLGDCLLSLHDQLRATSIGLEPDAILRTAAQLFANTRNLRGQLRTRLRQANAWEWQGRDDEAASARRDVLRAAEELGDRQTILDCLARRFEAALQSGDALRALAVAERRVDVARGLASQARLASALNDLARSHLIAGEPERAEPALDEALALADRLARPALEAPIVQSMIEFTRQAGHPAGLLHYANRLAQLEHAHRDADRGAARRTLSQLRDARTATRTDRIAQLIADAVTDSAAATRDETNRLIRDVLALAVITAFGFAVAAYRFGRRRGQLLRDPAAATNPKPTAPSPVVAGTAEATPPTPATEGTNNEKGHQPLHSARVLSASWARQFGSRLAVVRGQVDLLLDETPTGDRRRRRLDRILATTKESTELCRRMLEHSQATDPRPPAERPVDLRDVVTTAHEELLTSGDQTVAVRIDLPDQPIRAEVDVDAIQRLVIEVARLARGGSPGVRRIVIGVREVPKLPDAESRAVRFGMPRPAPSYAALQITVDGCGFSDAGLARIFAPTAGGDATTPEPGLAAARIVATSFGGAFRVAPDSPGGQTFSIYLPQNRSPEPSVELPRAKAQHRAGPILVVDDEDWLLAFTRLTLTQQGFRVIEASRCSEAMRAVAEADPKPLLAVIDLTLPDQDGAKLTTRVRELVIGLKVVIMSGHDEETIRAELGDVEVDAILPKPFAGAELVEVVGALLADDAETPRSEPTAAQRPGESGPALA